MANASPADVTENSKAKAAKKNPPTEENTGALELVMLRNNFYRDNYRRIMILCLLLVLTVVCLVGYIYYQHKSIPKPKYFATTVDGKIIKLTPLDSPNLTTNSLLQWASEAATSAYTFNFVNYRKALQEVRKYFTERGYRNFINALRDANNLQAIRDKKLVVSAVPTGVPVVLKEGVLQNGKYAWQVQVPMLIVYQSASEEFRQNVVLNMVIVRVPTLESDGGVGIESFVVREGG
jgi:intracellular multiplication protein IcmL